MTEKTLVNKGGEEVEKANDAVRNGSVQNAIYHLKRSLFHYRAALKHESCTDSHFILTRHTNDIMHRIEELEKELLNGNVRGKNEDRQQGPIAEGGNNDIYTQEKQTKIQLQSLKLSPEELPDIGWKDVIGLEQVKEILKQSVQYPFEMPQVYYGNRQPAKGILLYGPPGVGKTFIVKALAKECNISFFSISSASIISKYVGDSARNIKALFEVVKESKPCILFIDEIESLCNNRDSDGSGVQHSSESMKVVDEFLIQFDGITKSDMSGVLVIGATNYPWKLDKAILRRLELRVFMPLPSEEDRFSLLKDSLSHNKDDIGESISIENLKSVAKWTDLYSSSDITAMIRQAYRATVNDITNASYYKAIYTDPGDKTKFCVVPCTAEEYEIDKTMIKKMSYKEIPNKARIRPRSVTIEHLVDAMKIIKPVTDLTALEKFDHWTDKHGAGIL